MVWGTDSVWYGSPQWQIEALRRLEIPEDMRKQHGFAHGLVKSALFADNSARLYNLDVHAALGAITRDKLAAIKAEYVAMGGTRGTSRPPAIHAIHNYPPLSTKSNSTGLA